MLKSEVQKKLQICGWFYSFVNFLSLLESILNLFIFKKDILNFACFFKIIASPPAYYQQSWAMVWQYDSTEW